MLMAMKKCHYREAAPSMPASGNLRTRLGRIPNRVGWQPFGCFRINRYLYGIFMGNLLAGIRTHTHNDTHTCTPTLANWIPTNTALPSHSRCLATLNRFPVIPSWRSWNSGAHDTCASSLCGSGNRLSGTFIFSPFPLYFFQPILLG